MTATKPFTIPKRLVYDAWKAVKANAGSAGVDKETIDDFEADLKNNLYRIWNRMSSGSYFPPPVKAVAIPKKNGGERILGVPTVADRVAQMVVKMTLEPAVEPIFLPDSYGYRPGKSALDAVAVTRTRCWKYDWVLEFDIKGLFDNIDHGLLRKAVENPGTAVPAEFRLVDVLHDAAGISLQAAIPQARFDAHLAETRADHTRELDRRDKQHTERLAEIRTLTFPDAPISPTEFRHWDSTWEADQYFKRDDVGIIYQMNVLPGRQRQFIAAALLKAQFDKSAYGCKLYCCWCAQDIQANHFWEAMGFVPLAFRTGSAAMNSSPARTPASCAGLLGIGRITRSPPRSSVASCASAPTRPRTASRARKRFARSSTTM